MRTFLVKWGKSCSESKLTRVLHNHYCLLQVHYLEEKQKAPLASRLSRGEEYFLFNLIWSKKEKGSVHLQTVNLKRVQNPPNRSETTRGKKFVSYLSRSNYLWTACMTLGTSPGLLTLVSSVQAGSNRDPYMLLHCSWKKRTGRLNYKLLQVLLHCS